MRSRLRVRIPTAAVIVFFFCHGAAAQSPAPGPARAPESADASAPAQDRVQHARDLFDRAVKLSDEGRWQEAEAAFAESAEISPNASSLLNLAVARYEIRRPVEGLAALDRFDRLPDVRGASRDRAQLIRIRLEAQIAGVTVTASPASAELFVDGKLVVGRTAERPLRLDPGQHTITLSAPGYASSTRSIDASAGTVSLPITLVPVAVAASTPQVGSAAPALATSEVPVANEEKRSLLKSPWFWGGVGVVVAGTVTAVVLASQSSSHARASSNGGSEGLVASPKP